MQGSSKAAEIKFHEKYENDLLSIREKYSDNLQAVGVIESVLEGISEIGGSIVEKVKGELRSVTNKYPVKPEDLENQKYAIYSDDADLLVSAVSEVYSKEITNIIKEKFLVDTESNGKNFIVENDRIKSGYDLKQLQLKEMDAELNHAEKEARVEKRFADFWFKTAITLMTRFETSVGNAFAPMCGLPNDITERELNKFYNKVQTEPVDKFFKIRHFGFHEDRLEINKFANDNYVEHAIPLAAIREVEYFRLFGLFKFTLMTKKNKSEKENVANVVLGQNQMDKNYAKTPFEVMLVQILEEDEANKWVMLLQATWCQGRSQTIKYTETIDAGVAERPDFYGDLPKLLNYEEIEKFTSNSEFVLNPEENDKIDIFDRIHVESEAVAEAFAKGNK